MKSQSDNRLIVGLPQTGKTTYFADCILQDALNDIPIILFDANGVVADKIIRKTMHDSKYHIAYIDVGNDEFPIGINIFEAASDDEKSRVCNTVINLMYDLYDPKHTGIIGPRFEHAVRNAILTIMAGGNATFIELVRCLTDADYTSRLLTKVKDPVVFNYWSKQIAQTSDFHKSEVLDYIVSKFGRFITNMKIRNIIGQTKSTINFQSLLSANNIIIFDFSKLHFDEEAFEIINALLIQKLLQFLYSRCGLEDKFITVCIDEVSFWPSSPIIDLLKDAVRFAVYVILSSERLLETDERLRGELLRIDCLTAFRLATQDANIVAPEFHSQIIPDDLCLLPKYHAYMKKMENGNLTKANLMNLTKQKEDSEPTDSGEMKLFKLQSHKQFAGEKVGVEKSINERITS